MKKVKGYRYLFRRGEQFYFRRRVPKGKEWAFEGRDQVPVALHTCSLIEARYALAVEIAKFEEKLATAKGQKVSRVATKIAATHLPSKDEIEEQVRSWLRDRSERFSTSFAALEPDEGDAKRRLHELKAQSLDARMASGVVAAETPVNIEWIAEAIAEGAGWSIDKGTELWRYMVRLIALGQIEGNAWEEQDILGEPRKVGDERFSTDQYRLDIERADKRKSVAPVSLKGLLETYISEAELAPATIKVWRRQVAAFTTFLGHDNAQAVKQATVVAWKEHLLNVPRQTGKTLSSRTVRDTYGWEVVPSQMHSVESLLDGRKTEATDFLGVTLKSGPRCLNDEMAQNIGRDVATNVGAWAANHGAQKVDFTYGVLYGTKRLSNKKDWHILRSIAEVLPAGTVVSQSHRGNWCIGFERDGLEITATVRIGIDWWNYLGGDTAWIELCIALIRSCVAAAGPRTVLPQYAISDLQDILDTTGLPPQFNVAILQESQIEWLLFLARHFCDGFKP